MSLRTFKPGVTTLNLPVGSWPLSVGEYQGMLTIYVLEPAVRGDKMEPRAFTIVPTNIAGLNNDQVLGFPGAISRDAYLGHAEISGTIWQVFEGDTREVKAPKKRKR